MKRVAWVLWALRSSYRRGESGDGPSIIIILKGREEKEGNMIITVGLVSQSAGPC